MVSQDEMEYVLIRKHLLKSLGKHPLEMMAAQLENVKLEPERDATKMVAGEAADLSLTRCQRVLTLERERCGLRTLHIVQLLKVVLTALEKSANRPCLIR